VFQDIGVVPPEQDPVRTAKVGKALNCRTGPDRLASANPC
jgi:hypothetical protein